MERVQRPDGATSGVKVQPLSKGIGEGTVQCPFLGGRNFSPRRSRRPSGGAHGLEQAKLYAACKRLNVPLGP